MGAILSCVVAAAAPRFFVPPGRDLVPMRSSSLPVERVALPLAVELKLPLLSEERELRQVPLSTLRGSCFYVAALCFLRPVCAYRRVSEILCIILCAPANSHA